MLSNSVEFDTAITNMIIALGQEWQNNPNLRPQIKDCQDSLAETHQALAAAGLDKIAVALDQLKTKLGVQQAKLTKLKSNIDTLTKMVGLSVQIATALASIGAVI